MFGKPVDGTSVVGFVDLFETKMALVELTSTQHALIVNQGFSYDTSVRISNVSQPRETRNRDALDNHVMGPSGPVEVIGTCHVWRR